jgi:hypothetical protein
VRKPWIALTVALLATGIALAAGGAAGGASGGGAQAEAAAAGAGAGAGAGAKKPITLRIVTGTGNLKAAVKRFRELLGPNNGGGPGGKKNGRREIDWDSVPDQFAEPNALPSDFFNAKTAPRARGAILSTPGDHVAVSADGNNSTGTPVRFGDINASYVSQFTTFSSPRLFSPIGSNVVNLTFRVPGTDTPAVVRGFGAVYTDIDRKHNTAFRYFDAKGRSLGRYDAPVSKGGRSFLGVWFRNAKVARVRIQYGSGPLGPSDSPTYDAAVMDDFFYGEPRKKP